MVDGRGNLDLGEVAAVTGILRHPELIYEDVIRFLARRKANASPVEREQRRKKLAAKRGAIESWSYDPGPEIEPGNKVVDTDLDLVPLIVAGIVCSGEWRNKIDKNRNRLQTGDNLLQVGEAIDALTKMKLERAKKSIHGVLTHGIEVEIISNESGYKSAKQARLVDMLQGLGVDINYDGLREISLGKSLAVKEQLQAILSILKTMAIKPGQELAVHYTMGNLSKFDGDFYVLDQILEACALGSLRVEPGMRINVNLNPSANKPLYEKYPLSPMGLPFRVRNKPESEGVVVEYRWVGVFSGFDDMVKVVETMAFLAEAMEQAKRRNIGRIGADPDLADIWDDLKSRVDKIFRGVGLPGLEEGLGTFTGIVGAGVAGGWYPEAEEYADRVGEIADRRTRMRGQVLGAVFEARKKIRVRLS